MSAPTVVVVAGLPGAGKSTLIARAVDPEVWRVLDTDLLRRRLPRPLRWTPALYAIHYAGIARAILGRRQVVVHTRGTRKPARRAIAALARLAGADTVLLLLDAPRAAAEAGQRSRGRVLGRSTMDREAADWRTVLDAARSGALAGEGWKRIVVLDRPQAARVHRLRDAGFALVTQAAPLPGAVPSPDRPAAPRAAA